MMRRQHQHHDRNSPQVGLFVADLVDVPLRDKRDLMTVPTFSLSQNRRTEPISYHRRDKCLHSVLRTLLAWSHPPQKADLHESPRRTVPAG